jgi:hypothetical protein
VQQTVFEITPILPNPREKYQKQVESLCKLLIDEDGKYYRVPVFLLLTTTRKRFQRMRARRFSQCHSAKVFLRDHPADIRALNIIRELDKVYGSDPDEIDNVRGAVGEVFAYYVCRKLYRKVGIEVKVTVGTWTSGSIDTAGCSHEKGHCLQSKCSLGEQGLSSIIGQKRDLDKIERLTKGKAQGAFFTYAKREAFYMLLRNIRVDPSKYTVFDRGDLLVLEERLKSFSPSS